MNRILKIILIIVNIVILVIAILWYLENQASEPLIVCLGQSTTLLMLFFEREVSKIITQRISNNSNIDVDVQSGERIKTTDIDNSRIRIKTRK